MSQATRRENMEREIHHAVWDALKERVCLSGDDDPGITSVVGATIQALIDLGYLDDNWPDKD